MENKKETISFSSFSHRDEKIFVKLLLVHTAVGHKCPAFPSNTNSIVNYFSLF